MPYLPEESAQLFETSTLNTEKYIQNIKVALFQWLDWLPKIIESPRFDVGMFENCIVITFTCLNSFN